MEDELVHVGNVEMDEEESARFTEMERQADLDAEREIKEHRVSLRWTKAQVDLVRTAAAIYGITYQTDLKQAAVRQALADLKMAREACPELMADAKLRS